MEYPLDFEKLLSRHVREISDSQYYVLLGEQERYNVFLDEQEREDPTDFLDYRQPICKYIALGRQVCSSLGYSQDSYRKPLYSFPKLPDIDPAPTLSSVKKMMIKKYSKGSSFFKFHDRNQVRLLRGKQVPDPNFPLLHLFIADDLSLLQDFLSGSEGLKSDVEKDLFFNCLNIFYNIIISLIMV